MSKLTAGLALVAFALALATRAEEPPLDNPKIDVAGFLRDSREAALLREERRLSEAEFLALARQPGTVVLDARSRDKFAELHLRGAVSLPFTDFTAESLRATIPDPAAPVLIYCNNNFAGAEGPFPTKVAPAALNLSTFTALHSYGYRNVYELGPLIGIDRTRLELAGAAAPGLAAR